jgi:hypothetical protein
MPESIGNWFQISQFWYTLYDLGWKTLVIYGHFVQFALIWYIFALFGMLCHENYGHPDVHMYFGMDAMILPFVGFQKCLQNFVFKYILIENLVYILMYVPTYKNVFCIKVNHLGKLWPCVPRYVCPSYLPTYICAILLFQPSFHRFSVEWKYLITRKYIHTTEPSPSDWMVCINFLS